MTAHFVYRCFDADGALLYVGQTQDAVARMAQHAYSAFWATEVTRVKITAHSGRETARDVERDVIRDENPRFNSQGRWPGRDRWARQDHIDYVTALIHGENPFTARTRRRAEEVFANYAAAFGEVHPLAEAVRAEWAEHDAKLEVEQAAARIEQDASRRRMTIADARDAARHILQCDLCAAEGTVEYADSCGDEDELTA